MLKSLYPSAHGAQINSMVATVWISCVEDESGHDERINNHSSKDIKNTCMIIVAAVWISCVQNYSGHDEHTANHSGCQGSKSDEPSAVEDKHCFFFV
jgi:hypothetical protein